MVDEFGALAARSLDYDHAVSQIRRVVPAFSVLLLHVGKTLKLATSVLSALAATVASIMLIVVDNAHCLQL